MLGFVGLSVKYVLDINWIFFSCNSIKRWLFTRSEACLGRVNISRTFSSSGEFIVLFCNLMVEQQARTNFCEIFKRESFSGKNFDRNSK